MKIKVSSKSMYLTFNGCSPEHIKNNCGAPCCRSSINKTGILVTIHPSEEQAIINLGASVKNGLLQPILNQKRCPFQYKRGTCALHNTPNKPFGCVASPFTINKNGTLIIRNRYKLFKNCYNYGNKIPAYKAFRTSLNLIFGCDEAKHICAHLDSSKKDIITTISKEKYKILIENDSIKKGGNK